MRETSRLNLLEGQARTIFPERSLRHGAPRFSTEPLQLYALVAISGTAYAYGTAVR